jgi:uncharacterized repeat protein (TIGR01451 family)
VLSVQKSLLGRAAPGATVVYAITVANVGSGLTIAPIVVTDDLPATLIFQQVNAVGWSCTAAPPRVTCTYGAMLAPGQISTPVRITVTVNAPVGAQIDNVAVANSGSSSATGENDMRVADRAAPAPAMAPWTLLAAVGLLIAIAARRR